MRGLLAVLVACCLTAGPAQAAKMLAVFRGQAFETYADPDGIYGSPEEEYAARIPRGAFEGRFAYDTSLGRYPGYGGGPDQIIEGGSVWDSDNCPNDCPGPFTEMSFSIGGVVTPLFQGFWDGVYTSPGVFSVHPEGGGADLWITFYGSGVPGSLRTPFSAVGSGGGSIHFGVSDEVEVRLTSLTVSAIPEPATWAMMITGFGLMGIALRRRKPQPASLRPN